MTFPTDYHERVYAGVLGKMIGVYLGRPFEQWSCERIGAELGDIQYYVHERRGVPLVVTDDDLTGTFTFLRALPDHGCRTGLTPAQIGWTWRNYIIENVTILWWGWLGMSTEHTAFLRLKNGIEAPASGSIALNGQAMAEQIGAQIFIDGWGLINPGNPERAADFARRAASVSHDGEAIHGAQVIAAMEALAFVEPDLNRLLDVAVSLIPRDSLIYRMIAQMRGWAAAEPDWRKTHERLRAKYGYEQFPGVCHVVPNHAVIMLGLLYGGDDFQRALHVTNTAGYDTDCNGANVGCLLGVKNGLAGIEAGPDWRGPVADRLFLPTADGGRAITDAVRETFEIVNVACKLHALSTAAPKRGARFHFDLPGAVQGFREEDSPEARGVLTLENVAGHSASGSRALALHYRGVAPGRMGRAATATFIPPDALNMGGYTLIACPTLYPGQTVRARLAADAANPRPAVAGLYVRVYGAGDGLETLRAPAQTLAPGADAELAWTIPDTAGCPVAEIGVEISGASGAGTVFLDWLTWDGVPDTALGWAEGEVWRRAWVRAYDGPELPWLYSREWPLRLIQNAGTGLCYQGVSEWADYTVSLAAQPEFGECAGLLANVRGLFRHVALTLCADGVVRLVERHDATETVLAEAPCAWELFRTYQLSLTTRRDGRLTARVDGLPLTGRVDLERARGAAGMLVREGNCQFGAMTIRPIDPHTDTA